MTARERVARAWHAGSDHAAESPFGGPLCNCGQVAGRVLPMLRQAWGEGWTACRNDYAMAHMRISPTYIGERTERATSPNPYEEARS